MIEEFSIALSISDDCEASIYTAKVRLSEDLTEALPEVSASLQEAEFIPDPPVVVWTEATHSYTMRPREIEISNIADRDEANEVVAVLIERINSIGF
ncbi:MAG TPA: hypothetical protein VIK02_07340 [Candidatus Anoxymicrobiaceae bacterium]